MTEGELFRAMSELDDGLIIEARAERRHTGRIVRTLLPLAAAAAVLAFVLIPGGVSVSVDGRRVGRGGIEIPADVHQVRTMSLYPEPVRSGVELYVSDAEGAVFSVSSGELAVFDSETGEALAPDEPCTSGRVRLDWYVVWPPEEETPKMTISLRGGMTVVTLRADEARQTWTVTAG